jgi:hypothetical protein
VRGDIEMRLPRILARPANTRQLSSPHGGPWGGRGPFPCVAANRE